MIEDIGFPFSAGSRTAATASVQCSAKGCRAAAAWQLRWANPKIHVGDTRKTWLACPDHRDSLSGFLRARNFLREVEPFPSRAADCAPPEGAGTT